MGASVRSWKEGGVAVLVCPRSFSIDLAVLGFDDAALSAVPKMKSRGKSYLRTTINVFFFLCGHIAVLLLK